MKRILLTLFTIAALCLGVSAQVKSNVMGLPYRTALILSYSPVNNVFEDDNIRLEIYDGKLWALNKTKKTIFIDLSQCFLLNNGSSYPMFTEETNEKKASKKGNTTDISEYITIAPATGGKQNDTFICHLANVGTSSLYKKYSSSEASTQNFSEYEKRMLQTVGEMANESRLKDPNGKEFKGTVTRHFTEDESISNIGASLAYAFNKRAEDWTSVQISTWVCDATLAPYFIALPKLLSKKDKQGFGVKEQAPAYIQVKATTPFEYAEDRSPVIVADWSPNEKKGEFALSPIQVSKAKTNGWAIFGAILLAPITAGASAGLLATAYSEDYYKTVVYWNGDEANWHKMGYFKNGLPTVELEKLKTKQTGEGEFVTR